MGSGNGSGGSGGGAGLSVEPFFHFFVSSGCDGASEWCSDELCCESE